VRNFVNAGRQGNGRRAIEAVVIPPGWTGGDAGLKYVQRLGQLRSLIRVAGKHVSDKGIRELQAALPDLIVQQRGTASLGIRADQDPQNASNWRVSHVDPNSAAKRGGILPGDVIIRFAGKPVPDFDALVELIKQSQPGEEVEVVVRRGNGEATLQVKMGGWAAP